MRSDIAQLAARLIPKPDNNSVTLHANGNTDDIISVILFADKQSAVFTKKIAPYFKGANNLETARNIWNFLKKEIHYKDDGFIAQNIKSPAQFFYDREGDCKSFSIFTGSILQNLGIPYQIKLVSFSPGSNVTHVYIIIPQSPNYPNTKSQIIIDAVWTKFNSEKKYSYHKLFPGHMAQVNYVSGIGAEVKSGMLQLPDENNRWTDADIEIAIIRQRAEIMRDKVAGIGATRKQELFNDALDAIKDVQTHLHNDERVGIILNDIDNGSYKVAATFNMWLPQEQRILNRLALAKIRDAKQFSLMRDQRIQEIEKHLAMRNARLLDLQKNLTVAKTKELAADYTARIDNQHRKIEHLNKLLNQIKIAGTADDEVDGIGKHGKGKAFLQKVLKKASTVVKKATTAIVNVVTAPAKLVAKGALEISLPKAAPAFLYLFVTDANLISKLPPAAKKKREKAVRKADFICDGIGMKRSHFMGIVRNGILKRYGKDPEVIIAQLMKVPKVSGIGFLPAVLAAGSMLSSKDANGQNQLMGFLNELMELISKLCGKKSEPTTIADLPSDADFTDITPEEAASLAAATVKQAATTSVIPDQEGTDDNGNPDGGRHSGWCNFG